MKYEEIEKIAHRVCKDYTHSENESDRVYAFDKNTLLQFVQRVVETSSQWRHIESAPKDGTWIRLWRTPEEYLIASPEIIARWVNFGEDGGAWVWPDDNYDPYTERGKAMAVDKINEGDYFYDDSFTHWQPLPEPPAR